MFSFSIVITFEKESDALENRDIEKDSQNEPIHKSFQEGSREPSSKSANILDHPIKHTWLSFLIFFQTVWQWLCACGSFRIFEISIVLL